MGIDIARARRGAAQLSVEGGTPRPSLIEAAIALIQTDPAKALTEEYLGVKNYASFGDQREDHRYGYGPKHGAIVFSIGRSEKWRSNERPLDTDAIYFLEVVRDFGTFNVDSTLLTYGTGRPGEVARINFATALRLFDRLQVWTVGLQTAFDAAKVETHV